MAAKKLPFKTKPKTETRTVGDDISGTLLIPVFGDVTVSEQAWLTEQLNVSSTFRETARVSNKIARAEKGISPMAAHNLVSRAVTAALSGEAEFTEEEENLRIKYSREIDDLCQYLLNQQWQRQLATVAMMIRFRVKGQDEFTVEDAGNLPNRLVTDIYGLATLEQSRATFGADEPTEEEVKAEEEKLEVNLKK